MDGLHDNVLAKKLPRFGSGDQSPDGCVSPAAPYRTSVCGERLNCAKPACGCPLQCGRALADQPRSHQGAYPIECNVIMRCQGQGRNGGANEGSFPARPCLYPIVNRLVCGSRQKIATRTNCSR